MNTGEQNHLAQVTKSLKTSSAIAPSLLFTLICTPLGIAAAKFSTEPSSYFFMVMAILPAMLTLLQIVYFTFKDPDRLQNEEHVERKMLISRISPHVGDGQSVIEIDPAQTLTANPSARGGDNV